MEDNDPSLLPRSIRWRLQLGLLALPNNDDESNENVCSTNELYEYNSSLLHDQRTRYHDLVEKYEVHAVSTDQGGRVDETPAASVFPDINETTAAALDPLTAIVREQEAQAKKRQELELKYRKERARRNRGMAYQGENSESPTNNGAADAVRECLIYHASIYSLLTLTLYYMPLVVGSH